MRAKLFLFLSHDATLPHHAMIMRPEPLFSDKNYSSVIRKASLHKKNNFTPAAEIPPGPIEVVHPTNNGD